MIPTKYNQEINHKLKAIRVKLLYDNKFTSKNSRNHNKLLINLIKLKTNKFSRKIYKCTNHY